MRSHDAFACLELRDQGLDVRCFGHARMDGLENRTEGTARGARHQGILTDEALEGRLLLRDQRLFFRGIPDQGS